ncbi:MAG TPA: hypothetical protein VJS67_10570 [Pseudonocardiaceae bacterium]|nr:hypothetical protein [Pseudonocardiaceae bacterium]
MSSCHSRHAERKRRQRFSGVARRRGGQRRESGAARAISTYAAHSGFVIDAETGDIDVVHAISSAAARTTPAAGR